MTVHCMPAFCCTAIEVDRLIHLDSDIQGTADQLTKIRESVIDDVMLLIGHSYLCPNRIIAMAIDIYEKPGIAQGQFPGVLSSNIPFE